MPQRRDLDLESGLRVTCDVAYLCANFSLPTPLCSRLRADVCDRQTDVRQHNRLMPPPMGQGHNNSSSASFPFDHIAQTDDSANIMRTLAAPHYSTLEETPRMTMIEESS